MFGWLLDYMRPTITQLIVNDMLREQKDLATEVARKELTDVYLYTTDRVWEPCCSNSPTMFAVRGRYYVLVGAFQRNIRGVNQYWQLLSDTAAYGKDDSGVFLKYESVLTGAFLAKLRSAVNQPGGLTVRAEKISKLLAKETWADTAVPNSKNGPKP